MIDLQTPDVGNALRAAFDISGAGRFSMSLSDQVVPVAVVADVADRLRLPARFFSGVHEVAAVAGQYSAIILRNASHLTPEPYDIIVEDAFFWTSASTLIRYSLTATLGGAPLYAPQQRRSSLAAAATATSVLGANHAVVMTPFAGSLHPLSGQRPNWRDPAFIIEPGGELSISTAIVNVQLVGTLLWREEPR